MAGHCCCWFLTTVLTPLLEYNRAGIFAGEIWRLLTVAGTWIKVAMEQYFGASAATAQMIGAAVAVDGHLWGSLTGTALSLLTLLRRAGPAQEKNERAVQPS